ncbi:MAG: SpoIIE family protein phosphatase [Deltaproteobacteria bacterium]|nr:SpoIIE family protein phosphatase [Deltaproteobacteria bacterium]
MTKDLSECTILAVDDTEINLDLLVETLGDLYEVIVAVNGFDALEIVASAPPDLILLDIMMPGMDGYEVCRRLKADDRSRDIPVIFITAMGESEDETKGLELGAIDYLTKPINPAIVQARVKNHLQLKLAQEELARQNEILEIKVQERTRELARTMEEKERIQSELRLARLIQQEALPTVFPPIPEAENVEIFARMEPAKEVGGDYYDFFMIDKDHIGVVVADVSGKGVPAGLFMMRTRTLLRSAASHNLSAAAAISKTNDSLATDNISAHFVTVFYFICNLKTGLITFCNAGHPPPLIINQGKTLILAERTQSIVNPAIGVIEEVEYHDSLLQLEAGESLVVFTDGVTEPVNTREEMFGEERLAAVIEAHGHGSTQDICRRIFAELDEFQTGLEPFDDITVLLFKLLRCG